MQEVCYKTKEYKMDIIKKLAEEFTLAHWQVENTVELIDADNTIPFIARYRKEQTGEIDDRKLRELSERLEYLRNLEERKQQVVNTLTEQGNITDELSAALAAAATPKPRSPAFAGPKVGRNDPCPCGSGKKYKHCHGKLN